MSVLTRPTDPSTICEADKVKLIAVYERVCPQDVIVVDDPRRDCIAAEILDIGMASSADDGLEVILWWDRDNAENLREIVAGVRRSFGKLKLAGEYAVA